MPGVSAIRSAGPLVQAVNGGIHLEATDNLVREKDRDVTNLGTISGHSESEYFPKAARIAYGSEIARLQLPRRIDCQVNVVYHPQKDEYRKIRARNSRRRSLTQHVPSCPPTVACSSLLWHPNSLSDDDCTYSLTPTDLAEIDSGLEIFKGCGYKWWHVTKSLFPLGSLGVKLKQTRHALYHGLGFEVLRGLDVGRYTPRDRATVFLALSRYIASDCGIQDRRGTKMSTTMLDQDRRRVPNDFAEHIMDDNRVESQNDLPFHTDVVCDVIALMVVECSDEGGTATMASATAVYNELVASCPHVIDTLMQPDWPFDTFGRTPLYYSRAVLYFVDGKPVFSFSRRLLAGHPVKGRTEGIPLLTDTQAEAIDAVHFAAKKVQLKISMQKGDMRFINNLALLHGRQSYHDADGTSESRRHLIRLWLRDEDSQKILPPELQVFYARTFDELGRTVRWDAEPSVKDGMVYGRGMLSECD